MAFFEGGTINLAYLSISKLVTCNCDLKNVACKGNLSSPRFQTLSDRLAPRARKFSLLSTKRQVPFCANKFQFIKYTDLGGRVITSAKDMDLKETLNLCTGVITLFDPFLNPLLNISVIYETASGGA